MNINEALDLLGDDESFRATIYAMNTLLIERGVYSAEEFEEMVCEYAESFKAGFSGRARRPKTTSRETVRANP